MARALLLRLALAGVTLLAAHPAFAQSLETALMPGKVIAGHAKLEAECTSCHVRFDQAGQSRLCLACHKDVAGDYRQRTGFHGRLAEKECRGCHTEHKGRDARIAELDRASFDHRQTDFALRGAHASPKLRCEACHVPRARFREAPSECNACHRKDDVHKGSLGTACADCHGESDWKKARFDHSKTRFALRNRHAQVECRSCHRDQVFKNAPLTCIGCHREDDRKKGHQGRFGEKCESCHADTGWKPARFDHDRDTRYALKGLHRAATCHSCHRAAPARGTPTACVACHRADDDRKGHRGRFGGKCESCHVETGWKKTGFDHARDTGFSLRGRHAQAPCAACHKGNLYREKLGTACIACHRGDDQAKGHRGRFGDRCESCHVERSWKATTFDHARDARYPLRGGHAKARCDGCHTGTLYKDKLSSACLSCHRKDDAHAGQLGTKCESCHSEVDWRRAKIDHGLTRFPLLGKHGQVACKSCHASARFKDAPTDCYACHKGDDKHERRLGTQCEQCHQARGWQHWDFDHDRRTRFPLDGGHRGLDCLACHRAPVEGRMRLASTCASCHADQDVHQGSFGPQCERCHVTSSFRDVRRR
jgi:hypothetical protein